MKEAPMWRIVALVVALLVCTSARADTPQSGPITVPGVCIVSIDNTGAKTIAEWCGLTANLNAGKAGFTIYNPSTTQAVCLGGSDVNTTVTAGGKCLPVGGNTAAGGGPQERPVRGTIHKFYMRSSVAQLVFIMYGSTP